MYIYKYYCYILCSMLVTYLPGEPQVHWLRAPFAQERSIFDAFGELGFGPHASRTRVPQFQVVRHGGCVGRKLEKAETAVQTRADDANALIDSGDCVFFSVVIVAICTATTTPATVADDDFAATAAVTGQRTFVVAPTGVCVTTAATSIVATACENNKRVSLKSPSISIRILRTHTHKVPLITEVI